MTAKARTYWLRRLEADEVERLVKKHGKLVGDTTKLPPLHPQSPRPPAGPLSVVELGDGTHWVIAGEHPNMHFLAVPAEGA